MLRTIAEHRSIRKFRKDSIPPQVMEEMLKAATRASTTGGMQLYSIVVSESKEIKEKLAPCHFNQPMVTESAAVVTFCADVHRFSRWCEMRGAEPAYDNFMWWVNAAIDTLLASQNFSLEAENQGLGICYLGTTTYTADKIIEILNLPRGVVPVATVVVGYPEEKPAQLTARLPLEAVVHNETYSPCSHEFIDDVYRETEQSELTARLLAENQLPNLARVFTERRYKREDNLHFSREYLKVLIKQGFFEFDNIP